MSSWVGNPGRPPYVIPRGSAGLKKMACPKIVSPNPPNPKVDFSFTSSEVRCAGFIEIITGHSNLNYVQSKIDPINTYPPLLKRKMKPLLIFSTNAPASLPTVAISSITNPSLTLSWISNQLLTLPYIPSIEKRQRRGRLNNSFAREHIYKNIFVSFRIVTESV